MTGKVQAEAGEDEDDTDGVEAEFQGTRPAGRLEGGERPSSRRPRQQKDADDHHDKDNRKQHLMLRLVNESEDRTAEGRAEADETRDVDGIRRKQSAEK